MVLLEYEKSLGKDSKKYSRNNEAEQELCYLYLQYWGHALCSAFVITGGMRLFFMEMHLLEMKSDCRHSDFQSHPPLVTHCKHRGYMRFFVSKWGFQVVNKSTNKSITTNKPVATDTNWTQNFVSQYDSNWNYV